MALKFSTLGKPVYKRIMGVDCSTYSFAFSIFDDGELVKYGQIYFDGSTVFQRLADGQRKVRAFREDLNPDLVVFESAVFVRNKNTVIQLAYAFGAIIAALIDGGAEVVGVVPTQWQYYLGNKALTKPEKDALRKDTPGKSASWYQNKGREMRKQRTIDWAKKTYGVTVESDDVGDAIGLGHYGVKELA